MFEFGLHKRIENADERFCPFCPEVVENEFHFLFICPVYRIPREEFINPNHRSNTQFSGFTRKQKFQLIMSHMDQDLCKYVSDCTEIREFLVNRPKRCM